MVITKNDRRVNRTRRSLREALMGVILEKGYDAVTIEDITSRADVGRTTFYLHYRDKEELLQESINEVVDDLFAQVSKKPLAEWDQPGEVPGEETLFPIRLVFHHAAENADLYRVVLRGEGTSKIQNHIRNITASAVSEFLRLMAERDGLAFHPIVPVEVFSNYFAGSLLGVLTWWLENNMPYPAEKMASIYQRLVYSSANAVLGVNENLKNDLRG
jgi:AcrR family transcriptional regulator